MHTDIDPLVSILVPIYNVASYLDECLSSLIHQTYKHIEIICVNDGSTDDSPRILESYEARDARIHRIDQPNGGYGKAMNAALAAAHGDYIAIVESDDYADATMVERLVRIGARRHVDALKGNYYQHTSFPIPIDAFQEALKGCTYDEIFVPREDPGVFYAAPAIWSGFYRRAFLRDNGILFTETPGASFQDTAFNFKVWACAERALLTREAWIHYRVDNEASSVRSKAKMYAVNGEYAEIDRFLHEEHPALLTTGPLSWSLRFGTYCWNLRRLAAPLRWEYFQKMVAEFTEAEHQNFLDRSTFRAHTWNDMQTMLRTPERWFEQEFGPRNPDVTCYLAITTHGRALESFLNCFMTKLDPATEVRCFVSDCDPSVERILTTYRSHDNRLIVVDHADEFHGCEVVSEARGRFVFFANSQAVLASRHPFAIAEAMEPSDEACCWYTVSDHKESNHQSMEQTKVQSNNLMPSADATRKATKLIQNSTGDRAAADVREDYYDNRISFPCCALRRDACSAMVVSSYAIRVLEPLCYVDRARVRNEGIGDNIQKRVVSEMRYHLPLALYPLAVDVVKRTQQRVNVLLDSLSENAQTRTAPLADTDIHTKMAECEYTAETLAKGNNHAWRAFLRYACFQARDMRAMYKLLPESVRREMADDQDPSMFLYHRLYTLRSSCQPQHPRMSVIVPVYNKETYIQACIESIATQTLDDVEIICVDDGSSDASSQILARLTQTIDGLVVIGQTNAGASVARNTAMSVARGTYLAFMDADDYYPNERVLKKLYDTAEREQAAICGGSLATYTHNKINTTFTGDARAYIFDHQGRVAYRDQQYDYGFVRFIYRRDALESAAITFPQLAWFEDPVFLAQTMATVGSFYAIPDVVYVYRQTHSARQIVWTEERVCDCLRGIIMNLDLSRTQGLARLHAQTLRRLEGEYLPAIEHTMWSHHVLELLLKANQSVSSSLLAQADVRVPDDYIIYPLEHYTKIADETIKDRSTIRRLKKQNHTMRRMSIVQRGIRALPRYGKKYVRSIHYEGFAVANRRGMKTIRKKIV